MSNKKIDELLIDYAEGALDPAQRLFVEEELKKSVYLQNELKFIKETFVHLHSVEDREVPTHYFSSFLPRLREKISGSAHASIFVIPVWLRFSLFPVAAAVFLVAIGGLYLLLQPENAPDQMDQIVKEMKQSEFEDTGNFYLLSETESSFSPSVEKVVGRALLETEFDNNFLLTNTETVNSLYEYAANDRQILTQLDDDEIELIVNRLNAGSVQ